MISIQPRSLTRNVLILMLSLLVVLPLGLINFVLPASAALSSIVNDDFNSMTTGSFPTGWTLENGTGGTATVEEFPSASNKSMKLNDTSTTANVSVNRPFTAPAGLPMTAEFDIYPSQTNMFIAAGYILNSSESDRANTVFFDSSGSEIRAYDGSNTVNLQSYTANTWYHMKYVMDFNTKKYDVYINGVLKANNLGFNGSPQAGSKLQFFTSTAQTGSVYVDNVQVSTGGILKLSTNNVFDDFNSMTTGSAPTGYSLTDLSGGTITVQEVPNSSDKSVQLNKTSTLTTQNVEMDKTFTAATSKLTAEFEVMLGQTNTIFAAGYLADNSGNLAARVFFDSAGLIRDYNGATTETTQTYVANQWYRIKLVLNISLHQYDIYINGAIVKRGLSFNYPVTTVSAIKFYTANTTSGVMYVDNVNISSEGEVESSNYGSTNNVTGNPIGGGEGYSRLINNYTYYVNTLSDLTSALSNAVSGNVIYVDDSADIDVTSALPLNLKAGVTIASGRGKIINGTLSQGGRLKTVPDPNPTGSNRSIITVVGEGARVTGLRLDGGDSSRGDLVTRYLPWTNCVYAWGYNTTEVDNNDITGNRWGGVAINDGNVHHNKIHDNPYWELGYGIVQNGSNTTGGILIEGNLFDNNRHDIASTGINTSRYEARYNTTLRYDYGHAYDMHKDLTCGCAGDWTKIHHNTFVDTDNAGNHAIRLRGVPVTSDNTYNNWFYNSSWSVDIVQSNVTHASANFIVGTNKYGVSPNIQFLTNMFSTDRKD